MSSVKRNQRVFLHCYALVYLSMLTPPCFCITDLTDKLNQNENILKARHHQKLSSVPASAEQLHLAKTTTLQCSCRSTEFRWSVSSISTVKITILPQQNVFFI